MYMYEFTYKYNNFFVTTVAIIFDDGTAECGRRD